MRAKYFFFAIFFVVFVKGIYGQVINIPDPNFKAFLVANYDTNGDGEIEVSEAEVVTSIDTPGTSASPGNIQDLTGIEYFTNLTYLDCSWEKLTNLNVGNNIALETLYCNDNQLTELNVSSNTALDYIDCSNNQLTNLDVSNDTDLQVLSCCDNHLRDLKLDGDTNLQRLYCSNNQLTSLDVTSNTALNELNCSNNQLTDLDVSNNTALRRFYCGDNQLTDLDVSSNTALDELDCSENQLTDLDVSNNTYLRRLYCSNNQLTNLDVTNNTAIDSLDCSNNQLTGLDVTKNTALDYLDCSNNQLTSLDVSNNTYLYSLDCSNNLLTGLDVSNNTFLYFLDCSNNQLTGIDVTKNTALDYLDCSNNQLTSLDVSNNTYLQRLYCSNNQLTGLDVSNDTYLYYLDCSNNQLTSLDVSNNTDLEYLWCGHNQLTSLDVSNNTNLEELYCGSNQLSSLDISGETNLVTLNCSHNLIENIPDVSSLENINYYWCDHNNFGNDDCQTISNIKSSGFGTFVYNPQSDNSYLDCGEPHKLYIPHIATVYGWETKLIVDNGDSEDREVDVDIYKNGSLFSENSYTIGARSSLIIPITDGDCGVITHSGVNLSVRVSYIHPEGMGIAEFKLSENRSKYLTFKMPQYHADELTWMGLSIMNPTDETAHLELKAFYKNGGSTDSTKDLPPHSRDAEMVEDFFSNISSRNNVEFITVTSDVPICGINISGHELSQFLFTKASGNRSEYSTLYLPHIADDFSNWDTYLIFDNDRDYISEATVYLYDVEGNLVVKKCFNVEHTDSKILNLNDYKDLDVKCGTILFSGPGMHVRVAYVDSEGGTAEFELDGNSSKETMFTFPEYASDILDWMGIALYNPNDVSADVELFAYKDGEEVGNTNITIPAHTRSAHMLGDFFNPYPSEGIDYVVAYSSVPISGINISGSGLERLLFTKGFPFMDETK